MVDGECWVFVEHEGGSVKRASLELMAKGLEVAEKLSMELAAIVLGWEAEKVADELGRHGADKVYLAEHPLLREYQVDIYCKVVSGLASTVKPDLILFSSTFVGCDLAPRLAKRLKTGMVADCLDIVVDEEGKMVKFVKPSFGGNIMAEIIITCKPQIATVKPGVVKPTKHEKACKVISFTPQLGESDVKTRILERFEGRRKVELEGADVIVAGGRGVGEEYFKLLWKLARLIGGEVGGTRPAVDEGWISRERQIGQSGKIVAPKLYLAFGVSGALQHTVGFSRAGFVIAVNKDPKAPIFSYSDVGVVADVRDFLPALLKELEKGDFRAEES